jgi:hypothetical protein
VLSIFFPNVSIKLLTVDRRADRVLSTPGAMDTANSTAFAAAEPLCKRIAPASAESAVRRAFETLSFVANVLFLAIDVSSRSEMAIYCGFVKSVRLVNPAPLG